MLEKCCNGQNDVDLDGVAHAQENQDLHHDEVKEVAPYLLVDLSLQNCQDLVAHFKVVNQQVEYESHYKCHNQDLSHQESLVERLVEIFLLKVIVNLQKYI